MKDNIIKQLFVYPILLAFTVLGIVACSDDDDTIKEAPYMDMDRTSVSINRLGLGDGGEKAQANISSNVYWKGIVINTSDESWLKAAVQDDPKIKPTLEIGGYGDTKIIFTAEPNLTENSRNATIKLETIEGLVKEISVTQQGTKDEVFFVEENLDGGEEELSMMPVALYLEWSNNGTGGFAFKGQGQGAFIDKTNPSTGYAEASGANNIYFQDEDSYVVFGTMYTRKETAFKLSFGALATVGDFKTEDLVLEISTDRSHWVKLPYTYSSTAGKWGKAEAAFHYEDKYETLYFRLTAKTKETYRIDDIIVKENSTREGNELDFSLYVDDDKEIGYEYYFDDFSWIKVGSNLLNDRQDATSEIRFDAGPAQATADPEQPARLTASGWTWAPKNNFVYMHQGYVKMGRSGANSAGASQTSTGTLISPTFGIQGKFDQEAVINVKVSFKASMYENKDGVKDDLKSMWVRVEEGTPGTIGDRINKEIEFPMVSHYSDMTEFSFVILGATHETKVSFTNHKDFETARMFLDDVRVVKAAR